MNITKTYCTYGHHEREFSTEWCECPQAQAGKAALEAAVAGCYEIVKQPKTAEPWDAHRKRRLDSIATQVMLRGGEVRPKEQ